MSDGDQATGAAGEWSVGRVIDETDRVVVGLGFPQQERPSDLGSTYQLPTDVAKLTSLELGQLQLQLTGWYTYSLQILGKLDAELSAMEIVFEIKLGVDMQRIQDDRGTGKGSRIIKDALRALAVNGDDLLKQVQRQLIEMRMKTKRVEVQSTIYHEQLLRLSREQSRREAEVRVV